MLASTAGPGMMWLQIVGSAAVAQRASFGVRASCVLASATRPAHRETGDAAARTSPVPEDHTTQRFRIHMPHSGADVQRCIGAAAAELRQVEGRARPTPHARRILMKQLQSITVHRARTHAHAAGRLRHCSALSASAHTNWIDLPQGSSGDDGRNAAAWQERARGNATATACTPSAAAERCAG